MITVTTAKSTNGKYRDRGYSESNFIINENAHVNGNNKRTGYGKANSKGIFYSKNNDNNNCTSIITMARENVTPITATVT